MEFAQLVLVQLRQTSIYLLIGIWICRIISYYYHYVLFLRESHVPLGLFHTIPGMTGDYQTWTFKKVIDSLSELMNKGIAFAFTATQTCCRLPQAIANTYHEEQRIFLFSTLNHKFGKPANPHQVLSKINSFPEDLRGVGHSRMWVPMICLEQIGTSRACDESQ